MVENRLNKKKRVLIVHVIMVNKNKNTPRIFTRYCFLNSCPVQCSIFFDLLQVDLDDFSANLVIPRTDLFLLKFSPLFKTDIR
jgi:hypothetical protein